MGFVKTFNFQLLIIIMFLSFWHIYQRGRYIVVGTRRSSYCVTSLRLLLLLLLLPFCLFVFLLIQNFTPPKFYSSKILLIQNFTPPKFYSSEILLIRNGCWCTQLAAIAWHHSSDRAHKRLSLARTTGFTLCVGKITQMLIIRGLKDKDFKCWSSKGKYWFNDFNDSRYLITFKSSQMKRSQE